MCNGGHRLGGSMPGSLAVLSPSPPKGGDSGGLGGEGRPGRKGAAGRGRGRELALTRTHGCAHTLTHGHMQKELPGGDGQRGLRRGRIQPYQPCFINFASSQL